MEALWNVIEAKMPKTEARNSQAAELTRRSITGNRQEASISTEGTAGTAFPGLVEIGCFVEEVALIKTEADYSNWLGFSGAFGAGAVAFSTRAIRFERAAAGFFSH